MEVQLKAKETRHGMMLYMPKDQYVGQSIELYGEFSREEQNFFNFVYRGGSAIDVGANIGAHAVALVGKYGHVYAFEPQSFLYQLLAANLARFQNVTTYNAAVGEFEGLLDFPAVDYSQAGNFGAIAYSMNKDLITAKIQQRTLDGIEALQKEDQIDLIKVDVEGMERNVLEGAQRLISDHRPVLYVENDKKDKMKDLVTFIYNLDYRAYWHITFLYNSDNFFGNNNNVFPNTASYNLICLPNDRNYFELRNSIECSPDNLGPPPGHIL
jgi:FkbM family methyltransferase